MIEVTITYKSGKVEVASMALLDFTKNLVSLTEEGRLESMKITDLAIELAL